MSLTKFIKKLLENPVVARIVPGQYLAVDPKGRAVMIGACEKQN